MHLYKRTFAPHLINRQYLHSLFFEPITRSTIYHNMANTLSSFTFLLLFWVVLIQSAFSQISFPLEASSRTNCAGSGYCGGTFLETNEDCLNAINLYNSSYSDYRSYTSHYSATSDNACTAIYTCDHDYDYLTLNGYELQQM